jgi:hypothetical protein
MTNRINMDIIATDYKRGQSDASLGIDILLWAEESDAYRRGASDYHALSALVIIEPPTWHDIIDAIPGADWPEIPESLDDPLADEIMAAYTAARKAAIRTV